MWDVSFNVAKGRCAHCKGEGFVMVELLFLPSVYTPCPTCKGTRYNDKTLEVKYDDKNIAEVLDMTVDQAWDFFSSDRSLSQSLEVLRQVGLGYIRLGQPATELSGEKHSVSNWHRNCSVRKKGKPCTFWTNQRQDCIRLMWKS